MSTIMPQGESIRRAVKWVAEQLDENPQASIATLVNEASLRFDLNPQEQHFLMNFCKERQQHTDD